jgi:hypothetical protein
MEYKLKCPKGENNVGNGKAGKPPQILLNGLSVCFLGNFNLGYAQVCSRLICRGQFVAI